MLASSADILEQQRPREVAGVFHSRDALMAAAEALLFSGFDLADIDLSASGRRLNYTALPPVDLAGTPVAARRPVLDQSDALGMTAVIGSVCAGAAAVAVALMLVTKDMALISVGFVAV